VNRPDADEPERVPLFGTWRTAYIIVVVVFIVNVALFYAISRYFA
jgi:hypothetical protein